VPVRCDGIRVTQVLTNLVSNGIKYSPTGTEVVVTLHDLEDGTARIAVRDQGTGIPKDQLATIFEPFRRGERGGPPVPGTGLGLFVAKRIVEAHQGCIEVQSEPGRGSVFTVVLRPDPRLGSPPPQAI